MMDQIAKLKKEMYHDYVSDIKIELDTTILKNEEIKDKYQYRFLIDSLNKPKLL
jgi:hypothetical protein